jgi:ADP-ribosylglycohydrolase
MLAVNPFLKTGEQLASHSRFPNATKRRHEAYRSQFTSQRQKMTANVNYHTRLAGVLIGSAVGDSLGLPSEGLRPDRIRRRWHGEWKQRFIFGRGMCSDDTEHTFMVAQALLTEPFDADRFQRCLAWKLKCWLVGLPAGVGLATARAILKLWMGFPPSRSGIYSAGNGPAMRSAIIGAFFANDSKQRREFVVAATRITHTDPRAEIAALAVAEASAWAVNGGSKVEEFLLRLPDCRQNQEWLNLCRRLSDAYAANESLPDFCRSLGLERGVSGYAFHTVPVALYGWLRHSGDFKMALTQTLDCGGDTDTVGAIVGALAGASTGEDGIPNEWRNGILEWPRSISLMRDLAARLERQTSQQNPVGSIHYFWPGLVFRNLVFLAVVLLHGFRRLLPPY